MAERRCLACPSQSHPTVPLSWSLLRLAVGQRADLVVLGENPLDDLDILTDRVGVMVCGRWVTRADIDAGLSTLAEKHADQRP